jgi:hypothetical protein
VYGGSRGIRGETEVALEYRGMLASGGGRRRVPRIVMECSRQIRASSALRIPPVCIEGAGAPVKIKVARWGCGDVVAEFGQFGTSAFREATHSSPAVFYS